MEAATDCSWYQQSMVDSSAQDMAVSVLRDGKDSRDLVPASGVWERGAWINDDNKAFR